MGHLISSLTHLTSFSHAQCDAILQQRHIDIDAAYDPDKIGWGRDVVYQGLAVAIVFELVVIGVGVRSWLQKRRLIALDYFWRYGSPLLFLLGLVMLYVQLLGMAQYSDICRALLSGGR